VHIGIAINGGKFSVVPGEGAGAPHIGIGRMEDLKEAIRSTLSAKFIAEKIGGIE